MKCNVSIETSLDQLGFEEKSEDCSALRQLLTHVPDVVIHSDHKTSMPRVNRVIGVCMFADISGEVYKVKFYWRTQNSNNPEKNPKNPYNN